LASSFAKTIIKKENKFFFMKEKLVKTAKRGKHHSWHAKTTTTKPYPTKWGQLLIHVIEIMLTVKA